MPDINNTQNKNNNMGSPFINSAPSNPRNINYGVDIARDFPYDPWENYEPLFDLYPRYKSQIQEAFNRGIPRRFVEKFLNEHVEPKLNFVGTPDQVNSFLGRDEASQQRLRDYNEAKRFQTFREAFPDKSDQEISDAFAVSQSNGVSPQALLQYPELMKKIVDGRKLHEGYIDSVIRGGNNLGVTLYSGYIGMKYLLGGISKEEANKQWADSDKYLIEEPLNTDVLNRFLAGGANVTSQGFTTMAGGAAGAKIGAWLGGLIGGPPGAIAGGAIGSYVLPALEMFTLQAGNDMREFANKTDLNGQPINENAARFAAGVTGLITTATEMFTLKKAMAMFPGANKLFGWNKESVQHAISNPNVNQALSKIAEDFFSSLNWSTAHNVIESAGSMAGDVLSEYISGQPFPQKDLRFVENIIETILNSYRDFTASGLVNAIPRLMGLAVQQRKARNVQQGRIREFANFMGVSTEGARQALNMLNEYEYEKKKSESDSENKQQDVQPQEAQSDVQNEQTEQQDIQPDAVSEVQPETQPQDVQQEVQTEVVPEVQQENQQETNQKSIHDYDYIYLPKSELQKFIQDNPDFADIHGIDSDSETALTPEQFERISSANSEFISSIMNDIRFGSNGMTVHEAQLKLDSTDPEKAEFFHSEENQKLMQSVTQQLLDAGIEEQEANDLALLWGVMGTNLKVTEGISIKAPVINQQEITQIDYSRLSPEYDINNPDTWPDRERAEKFKEAVAWGKLPEAHSLVQNIFDYLRGNKPERADDLQPQSEEVFKGLKQEAPDKVKSTRNDLAKQELDDYKETLRQANLDTIHSLNLRDNPDPARYEFNSQFPKGKSRNPTEQYYFENFDGKTRIDVATDGTDLKVRIKSEGNKDTAIFAIKNYRSSVLSQVLGDVLGGFSIDGIQLSETPAAMYLSQALRSFWDKFGLKKANINTASYSPNLDVQKQSYTPDVNVQTESLNPNLDVNTETYTPEVDSVTEHYTIPLSVERLERDFNLERTPAPDAHSVIAPDAEQIRKNIPTQSITEFDKTQAPKAEAYSPDNIKINVQSSQPDIKLGVEHLPLELVPQSPHGPDYDRDNSVVFDEDNFSPDYEQNNAAVDDLPEQHVPDYEAASPETKRENMPEAARFKLAQDEQAWHKTVDRILADDSITDEGATPVYAMKTPLVFSLVDAKHPAMELDIDQEKIKRILNKHHDMTPEQLKDLARALTDPTAIFESGTRKKSVEVLTDLKGEEGYEVLVAVNLNQQKGTINKIDSAYPKVDRRWGGSQPYRHYQDAATKGRLLYLNRQKAAEWAKISGVDLAPFAADAKTEADLISLWNKHKENGYYYTDKNGNPIAFTSWKYGRAVINFLQNTNVAADVHEFGHAAFFLMQALEKQGSVGMRQDIDIILNHAGVTREAFDADIHRVKGGAREIAQEYFAKAWEAYLAEGKAPNKKLQPVFTRIRKLLLDVYDDITNQLGIQLDDEVRGVFDRLLGMDEDTSASVADIVQNELRVENQIKAYETQQRELLAQQNESFQDQHELETDPHLFDIDEQSAQYVDEWINQRDYQEILDDEFKSKKEMTDFLIAAVKDNGHINYQSIKELAGEKAHQIYNAWRRLFAKGGMHIDDMQSAILNNYGDSFPLFDTEHSTHALLDFLENNSPLKNSDAPSMIAPKFAVNTNLVNAFLAADGVDGTVDYLKTRLAFLEQQQNQTDDIKAEINEINEWLKRLDADFDEELKNPHKRSKRNISQRDLRRSINTAFKMGEQSERVIQEAKSQIQMDKMQSRLDEQLQATEAKYQDKLQAQKDKAQQREETLTERFKSQIQNLKEKDRARLEAKLQQLQEAREQDKAKHKERLERITQALQDRADNKLQRKQQQFQRKIDSLQERINNLRNARDAKQQKSKIKRLVRSIVRMGKSKSISVNMQQEIRNLLNEYNLDRKGIEDRDAIRKFLDVKELPVLNDENSMNNELAEFNLTQQDVDDFLSKIHIEDMSLSDVQVLHQAVSDLFTQGREEYQNWKQERDNRRADYHDRLVQPLLKLKAPEKTVVTSKDDINKQFSKAGDMANQFWDSIQTPGRFLASLGEDFRRLFDDGVTSRRDKLYTGVDKRKQSMLQNLKQLGLSLWDFAKPAITIDGKTYSWTEVHAIWNAFKNEKSKLAVLWGNFINNQNGIPKLYDTQDEAMTAINQIFELMHQHPEHIKAAELIIQEFEQNFQRLHDAGAQQFNTDIRHEKNYTPMDRLRYQSPQGLIDAETENLAQSGTNAQIMRKVENGFTQPRIDIDPMNQQPVRLDAWGSWLDAVTEQEYYIHLAGYAADLQSALLTRDENGNSVVDLIKSRRGLNDWNTLKSIFNDSITDKDLSESEAVSKLSQWLLRARSFFYIPFRPVTAVIQSASYLTAFPYTSHGHLFRSLAKFIGMWTTGRYNEFMENVFQKAGELRFASGDFADETYRKELMMSKSLPAGAKAIIDKYGYAGVRFVDRTTKALVFHAAYESNIENGMSEEDAVRLANRAVRDTQPASSPREATRLNRKNGMYRFILTQFMAPLAPVFNMAVVDVARALAHPSWNNVKAAACFAISAGMTMLFSQFLRDLAGRRLPNGEEDDYGNVDTWGDWILNGLAEGVLGSLPVFNNGFITLYRMLNGRKFNNENRLDAPFVSIGKAINYVINDDYEGQYNDKAVNELVKALALFGIPLPYAAFRDIYRLFKGNEE